MPLKSKVNFSKTLPFYYVWMDWNVFDLLFWRKFDLDPGLKCSPDIFHT